MTFITAVVVLAASLGAGKTHNGISNWYMSGAYVNKPFFLSLDSAGVPYFDFFLSNSGQYDGYLTTGHTIPLSGSITMTVQVVTTGSPVFNYMSEPSNTCPYPANVRPFFWSNNAGWGEFDRWWSNPVNYVLNAGTVTLSVPLSPESWSSVYGKFGNADASALAAFSMALSHPSYVGMTFGGGCFAGHGVNVVSGTGTARFRIMSYTVQ